MIVPYRYALAAALLLGIFGTGYALGRQSLRDKLTAIEAVADATQARYRTLEKETADAQAAYVKSWAAARDADRAERLRILARVSRGVSAIPTECAGAGDAQGAGLERHAAPLTAGEVGDALSAGAELEQALMLCQSELRRCASVTATPSP